MTTLVDPRWGWLLAGAPALLALVALLSVVLVARGQVVAAAHRLIARWMRRHTGFQTVPGVAAGGPGGVLRYTPPIVRPETLIGVALGGTVVIIFGLGQLAGLGILRAMLVSIPLVGLVVYATLVIAETVYARRLERMLTPAVGRFGMAIANGTSFVLALEGLVTDLEAGPLRGEWTWMRQAINRALPDGTIVGPRQAVGALAVQTPSRRHAAVLRGLEVALGQTQAVQAKRLDAEYQRLLRSDMRRSTADAELTMVRLTGFIMSGAILVITGYMYAMMPARFNAAYGGTWGLIAAPILLLCALAPSIGGLWLSRVEDLE